MNAFCHLEIFFVCSLFYVNCRFYMNYEKTAEPTDLCSDMGGKSSQKSRVKHQFYQPSIIGFILRCISLGDFLLPDWNDCKLATQRKACLNFLLLCLQSIWYFLLIPTVEIEPLQKS